MKKVEYGKGGTLDPHNVGDRLTSLNGWAVTFGTATTVLSGVHTKGVASMRQDEAIASSCFRRRQIFAHLFHDKSNVNFN